MRSLFSIPAIVVFGLMLGACNFSQAYWEKELPKTCSDWFGRECAVEY